MKFLVVIGFVLVLFTVTLAGCAGIQKAACDNRDRINDIIVQEQIFQANLKQVYGPIIPANIQQYIDAAQMVINECQMLLAQVDCPADVQVQAEIDQAAHVKAMAMKAGVKGIK